MRMMICTCILVEYRIKKASIILVYKRAKNWLFFLLKTLQEPIKPGFITFFLRIDFQEFTFVSLLRKPESNRTNPVKSRVGKQRKNNPFHKGFKTNKSESKNRKIWHLKDKEQHRIF